MANLNIGMENIVMLDFWKILRILTTNECNYNCLYCHNEGQEKEYNNMLSYENFRMVLEAIEGMGFQEIRFSGGEPLINLKTIDMIEWINSNSDYEVGLASNGSLISDDVAKRLGKTRTMVTLHLPAVKSSEYQRTTGKDNEPFWKAMERLEENDVKYSFNYVLYPETIDNIEEVIEYALSKGKRIKLLPYIERGFNNYSSEIIQLVTSKLDNKAISKEIFKAEGITNWIFDNNGKVKLIESPCYSKNVTMCREYGELRLLPNLSLQKCIFDNEPVSLINRSKEDIQSIVSELWNSFNSCR